MIAVFYITNVHFSALMGFQLAMEVRLEGGTGTHIAPHLMWQATQAV
jgi:hypothetical protein